MFKKLTLSKNIKNVLIYRTVDLLPIKINFKGLGFTPIRTTHLDLLHSSLRYERGKWSLAGFRFRQNLINF